MKADFAMRAVSETILTWNDGPNGSLELRRPDGMIVATVSRHSRWIVFAGGAAVATGVEADARSAMAAAERAVLDVLRRTR
jgi:hypothetical protein